MELLIERPASGGRMIARHEGQIVFVAGAIPGERVRVRIERSQKSALWAQVVDVLEPSPDRREAVRDPACGGLSYSHISLARQRQLKGDIIADAFRRLGHIALDAPPSVAPSPETGYRLRARQHVRGGRAGFFREGTHDLCDAGPTQQLRPETTAAASALLDVLRPRLAECDAIVVAENHRATERVFHIEPHDGARLDDLAGCVTLPDGAHGLTTLLRGRFVTLAGATSVTDSADDLFQGTPPVSGSPVWTRRASSFFQGNRFLTGALVRRVLELAEGDRVIDLYAGVGLFSIALAARGSEVVAVEGDRSSSGDLTANAEPWERLRVVHAAVEDIAGHPPEPPPDVVVLDPPRTGISAAAVQGLTTWQATRLVYVSCDPPTLARDAARFVAAGYDLTSIDAFDFFPNTPHVETVAVFQTRAR